jgi:AraC family transcriptional regulator, regulatory protein of adaptative response / methylated-DNA-[protein]-cysteine methyltransferase
MIEPDEIWWNAIRERDAAFAGALFYGVVTTGIYCRPGCPSRRPNRANVRFFPDANSAERAGLRPCKRCRPETATTGSDAARLVVRCCDALAQLDPLPPPARLARDAGVSERTLRRDFNALLGISPGRYLQALKAQRLRAALRNGERVTDAVYSAGYGSSGRAYENAPGRLGMTPSDYAASGAGVAIDYCVRNTRLGWLLVAATERGLCFARFGSSRRILLEQFKAEFAAATVREAANDWIEALLDFADGQVRWRVLPVDIRGTAFQERVWRALRDIPAGQTRTYADVAAAIGAPKSVRAVANACGANPVAVAVPCHRVLPKAGGVGGYRWGTATKQRLLESEATPPRS